MSDIIISEKRLEDYIYNHFANIEYGEACEDLPGVGFNDYTVRQLNIQPYGIIDIAVFGWDFIERDRLSQRIVIYELKKDIVDKNTLVQGLRYVAGMKDYITSLGGESEDVDIDLVLIGRSISEDMKFVPKAYNNIRIFTYDLDINTGLTLNEENGWNFIDKSRVEATKQLIVCRDYADKGSIMEYLIRFANKEEVAL